MMTSRERILSTRPRHARVDRARPAMNLLIIAVVTGLSLLDSYDRRCRACWLQRPVHPYV
jgi:hypothetical protein